MKWSPRIWCASCISFGIIVTCLAWIAHKFVSSNRPTKNASAASCSAIIAEDWNLKFTLKSWATSLISLWNGNFWINNSMDLWYLWISMSALVPGWYLCGFFNAPVDCLDLMMSFCVLMEATDAFLPSVVYRFPSLHFFGVGSFIVKCFPSLLAPTSKSPLFVLATWLCD